MYELLSKQYSSLFPPDESRCGFVIYEAELSSIDDPHVLDAGCANGDLAFELSANGCIVTGIDFDSSMIAEAQARAAESDRVSFFCGSMTDLDSFGRFSALTCFGNTLPHLPDLNSVLMFFTAAAEHLKPGGKLIFQLINFDKPERKTDFSFPDIETEETIFKRRYSPRYDGRIDFTISLTDKASGETAEDHTVLLPLERKALIQMLGKAGFTDVKIYTDYSRTPADGSEFASVYSASV